MYDRPSSSTVDHWPTVEEVLVALGAPSTTPSTTALETAAAAAADRVRLDTGYVDPDPLEVPAMLWEAALLLAVVTMKAPEAPFGIAAVFDAGALHVARRHPAYGGMIKGHRRGNAWGIA